MQQKTFTIVGLRHHEWQGVTLGQRLRQAPGKRVVLVNDKCNEWNREATGAWIDTLKVGYVKNDECHEATGYCLLTADHVLQGRVVQADVEHRRLTVTVDVGDGLTVGAPVAGNEYDGWYASSGELPELTLSRDEERLDMLQRDLAALLRADGGLDDTLLMDLTVYEQLMTQDLSREATFFRRNIVTLMCRSRHEAVRQWGHRLDVAVTGMGSPETCEQLASHLLREVPASEQFRTLLRRHPDADLGWLEQQLHRFPHRLYDEFRVSPSAFMAKLYYRMVPARVLRRFLTTLLMAEELRGRLTQTVSQEQALRDVLDYTSQIDHCATADWQGLTAGLWQQLATRYRQRLTKPHASSASTFNRRFACQLVGTLLQLGVYRRDVPQTEYTALLEGDRRSSLRKSINQGVDDDETRLYLRQLVRR